MTRNCKLLLCLSGALAVDVWTVNDAHAQSCPLPSATQASLYQHANFQGACRVFEQEVYSTVASLAPVPNDQVSSIGIGSGVRLLLAEHERFGGRQFYFDGGWNYGYVGDSVNDLTSSAEVFPAQGGQLAAWYLGDYPNNNPYWAEGVQGIAHDDSNWFIAQTTTIQRIELTTNLATVGGGSSVAGIPSEMPGYNHFGDIDQSGGFVFAPVQGPGKAPAVAVYLAQDLSFWGWTEVPGLPSDGGAWLAYRPGTDTLVLSASSVNGNSPLYEYAINWNELIFNRGSFLSFSNNIYLYDRQWNTPTHNTMQGGAFSPDGQMLYVSNGYCDTSIGYISAFYTPPGETYGVLQGRSENGAGAFNFEHHPGTFTACAFAWCTKSYCTGDEPEGLDYFDVGGRGIPGISEGQLHALVLNNEAGDDQIFFKHYSF
jgi:DNA-binding beta-propeller fold protein YncE